MTLSGSSDFTNTRNEILYAAMRKCGMLAEGETPTAQMISDAADCLERIVKAWQAEGLHLWTYAEYKLFLETGKAKYSIGSTGDHVVNEDDLTTTVVKVAGVATDLTIDVDSITGISDGDYIGIVMDDDTIHWTTVNGAPAGDTVTLTAALDAAAAIDNAVYVYTTKAVRPLQVTHGRTQVDSTNEIILDILGREDYFSLSNKTASGVPVQIYYNPSLTNGTLYVWPTVSDETQYLNLTVQKPIDDFDAAGNNPSLPVEWLQPLVWNTALDLGPEYGIDDSLYAMIKERADYWYERLLESDTEQADLILTVEMNR
jgi:hypothetical protein